MKTVSLTLLIFLTINLYADKNWIPIEPINKTKTSEQKSKLDVNLSQIAPINKMIKNAKVFKQLLDSTDKKEKVTTNDKNWFVLEGEDSK